MGASKLEQDFAQTSGVSIRHWLAPVELRIKGDHVCGVRFDYTRYDDNGQLVKTGKCCEMDADVVFKAVGQQLLWDEMGDVAEVLELKCGRIGVSDDRRTSLADVWAGGDCVFGGEDLTVSAVQDGKVAAMDIDRFLRKQES